MIFHHTNLLTQHVLGISNSIHNSAACLVDNGTVLAAVEEERTSRYKRDGRPPIGAVNALLTEHQPKNITRITISGTVDWSMKRQVSSIYQYARSAFNPFKTARSSSSPAGPLDPGGTDRPMGSLRTQSLTCVRRYNSRISFSRISRVA